MELDAKTSQIELSIQDYGEPSQPSKKKERKKTNISLIWINRQIKVEGENCKSSAAS